MLTQAPRGTKDILPDSVERWRYVEEKIRDICERFGYREIRTPLFEHTELFQRGIGDTAASMRGGVIQLVSKVAVIAVGAQIFRSLPVIWLAWPVSFTTAAAYLYWHMRKKSMLSVDKG